MSDAATPVAYRIVKVQDETVSLNLLYSLYGALHDLAWNRLSAETKQQLRAEAAAVTFST